MPFTPEQLAYAGRAALDFYLKNSPIDQVNIAHPLLEKLIAGKKEWGGGLQYVVEQLRYQNDSNFQAYFGDSQVTYNRKRTLQQAKYTWGSFHDGFGLNEDELTQNGIQMTDDRSATPTDAEKVQLSNLLDENMETLKIGFQEGMDFMLHRDGTQNPLEVPGLDHLVSLAPSSGTVGGLAASATWWRNYADTAVGTTANPIVDAMEAAHRECVRRGGKAPDFYLAGEDFIDAYRSAASETVNRQITLGGSKGNRGGATLDASVGEGVSTGLFFKGKEILWDPVFSELDAQDSPTVTWASRLYMLNTEFIKLRPIKGHWMIPRRPPRVYDRYTHYWALTAKAAMTTSKRNAHAVLALA
jgi:hypothetical protein